ncbi:hypothetical protein M422DRAFT_30212 [Sphaerobolus stellatus SS14]|uniref:Uncharacterized protein n=1 Tax=Sphaerobolus stellatus (strain SS14) TaxID=990650 RepID=A0A0C9W008_SPHS4|nr:hypothetical protein M422DRAFT_30212 [Sphaerobolus stellatus SS14]
MSSATEVAVEQHTAPAFITLLPNPQPPSMPSHCRPTKRISPRAHHLQSQRPTFVSRAIARDRLIYTHDRQTM